METTKNNTEGYKIVVENWRQEEEEDGFMCSGNWLQWYSNLSDTHIIINRHTKGGFRVWVIDNNGYNEEFIDIKTIEESLIYVKNFMLNFIPNK